MCTYIYFYDGPQYLQKVTPVLAQSQPETTGANLTKSIGSLQLRNPHSRGTGGRDRTLQDLGAGEISA